MNEYMVNSSTVVDGYPVESAESAVRINDYFTFSTVSGAVLASIIVPFLYQIVYYRFFHPLKDYPGPFWGSVTRIWHTLENIKGTELETYQRLLEEKKTKILRISPTELLVPSALSLPQIYHRQAVKTKWYVTGALGPGESVFNMQPHSQHAHFRRLIALPYSFSRIQKSESLVDEVIIAWIKKLDELFATTDKAFDMAQWATYAAFDVISLVGFGEAFGFVETATDVNDLIKELHRGFFYFGIVGRLYPFVEFIKRTPLGKFLVSGPKDKGGMGLLIRWTNRIMAAREKEIADGKNHNRVDLLQSFYEARDPAGQPLTEDHIRAECMLLFTAGADTTGTTMGAMMNYMLGSPIVYGKMLAEIDSAFERGVLSKPIPTSIEVSKNCPYYVACVKESLRLCPSAPNIFPRLVQADHAPLVIDGKTIPVGTEITSTAYMANRDPELYGEDANEFRPDRWLEEDGEKGKLFDKYLATFGFGTRGCLGKELAMMELMKTPLMFFRHFEPRLCLPSKETPATKRVLVGAMFYWDDVWIKIRKREGIAL
ncbi:Cytochrome P450 protein [Rutstroemia sp. NJR-2017a WRK4]|nr:Cytochrome P450 protein [Rutstroemia sp. NJR-2017a WRK4]